MLFTFDFSARVKRFLNVWNVVILTIGLILIGMTIYSLTLDKETFVVPTLAYHGALSCGIILISVAGLGIQGLRQHRVKVTKGKRNCCLSVYVIISAFAAAFVVCAGAIALEMTDVIDDARTQQFAEERVTHLEEVFIDRLDQYVRESPNEWIQVQNSLLCCGYQNPRVLSEYLSEEFVKKTYKANNVYGDVCTREEQHCDKQNRPIPCPRGNKKYCRTAFLDMAFRNSRKIGAAAVLLGFSQIVAFVGSLYILLCDSRIDPNHLPEKFRDEDRA